MKKDSLQIEQQALADAWQRTLPTMLEPGDAIEVRVDEAQHNALHISIHVAGRQDYSLDFKVEYVDSREIKAQFIDVEKDGRNIDERTPMLQELIQDYTRHLNECAQALQQLTHA